ncbi:MAG TPA: hypothetical protein VMU17_01875 [Elusimicrobiota bacterium]|nr:hypothetical protein [Elusimicrobiota bacterium]
MDFRLAALAALAGAGLLHSGASLAEAGLHHQKLGHPRPFAIHRRPFFWPQPPFPPEIDLPPISRPPSIETPLPSQPAPQEQPLAPPPPLPSGMVITVEKTLPGQADASDERNQSPVSRPRQAAERLAQCWSPPEPASGDTVEVTLRFGFNSKGEILPSPRITYVKAGKGVEPEAVRESILAAVKSCTPLHFTPEMAANIPGEPLAVRFVGRRREKATD